MADSNDDVGGEEPLRAEDPSPGGDGYEELLFDAGRGADPDAAWIRISPSDRPAVEIAFKQNLLTNSTRLLWPVWADAGVRAPGQFDYNDSFTLSRAGSPDISSDSYPLAELALVDNSCRWGFGFTPTGDEPGVCYIVPPTPRPTNPPPAPTPTFQVIN